MSEAVSVKGEKLADLLLKQGFSPLETATCVYALIRSKHKLVPNEKDNLVHLDFENLKKISKDPAQQQAFYHFYLSVTEKKKMPKMHQDTHYSPFGHNPYGSGGGQATLTKSSTKKNIKVNIKAATVFANILGLNPKDLSKAIEEYKLLKGEA